MRAWAQDLDFLKNFYVEYTLVIMWFIFQFKAISDCLINLIVGKESFKGTQGFGQASSDS